MPDLRGQPDPGLEARIRVLSGAPLFAGITASDLAPLARCAHERAMQRGEVLFQRGDAGSSMMFVLAGQVRVGFIGITGRDRMLRVFRTGDVFGEIALLDGGGRTANAIALTNGRLLVLERRDLLSRMQDDVRLALRVVAVLCQRLRATTVQLEALLFHDASTRLAATLLSLTQGIHQQRTDVTQSDLAEMVGVARETINKKLREWERAGLVDLTPGRIVVRNRVALSAILTEAGAVAED